MRLVNTLASYFERDKKIDVLWNRINEYTMQYGRCASIFRSFLLHKHNKSLIQVIFCHYTPEETMTTLKQYKLTSNQTVIRQLINVALKSVDRTTTLITVSKALSLENYHFVPTWKESDLLDPYRELFKGGIVPRGEDIKPSHLRTGYARFKVAFIKLMRDFNIQASYDKLSVFNCADNTYRQALDYLLDNKLVTAESQTQHVLDALLPNCCIEMTITEFEEICELLGGTDCIFSLINSKKFGTAFMSKFIFEFEKPELHALFSKIDYTQVDATFITPTKFKIYTATIRHCIECGAKSVTRYHLFNNHLHGIYQSKSIEFLRYILSYDNSDINTVMGDGIIWKYIERARYTMTLDTILYKIIKCLLRNGAQADYISRNGESLFHFICRHKVMHVATKVELIDLIAKFTGDETETLMNMTDSKNQTALGYAETITYQREVQDHLLAKYNAHD